MEMSLHSASKYRTSVTESTTVLMNGTRALVHAWIPASSHFSFLKVWERYIVLFNESSEVLVYIFKNMKGFKHKIGLFFYAKYT